MNLIAQKILTGLNDQQRKAVKKTNGPLLVRAGAGSGKTRVLTRRIAYLINVKHVDPFRILAITFTNKAATEMQARINRLLGTSESAVWASTFHSLGLRILKHRQRVSQRDLRGVVHNTWFSNAQAIGYRPSFTIAGPSTQKTITKNIIGKELNKDTKEYDPGSFHDRISDCKNELVTPQDYHEQLKDSSIVSPLDKTFEQVYIRYQSHLRQNEEMDFDDLIMLPVLLFKKHPEVLHRYQKRFKYISVDEYQDTNHAQYEMVKMLADKYHNICAVGDENQSIYGWRGADIRNIRDFSIDYPNATEIYMEQNYRSTKNILGAADSVIKNNYKHFSEKQRPWTSDNEGCKVDYMRAENDFDEAQYVINEIGKEIALHQYSYKDFAVLYRQNAQSRKIEDALIHAGMPYHIVGGHKFYDRKEVQDTLAYLSLLVNPDDSISFERVVNVPKRGIGNGTMNKFRLFANSHHWSLMEASLMLNSVKSNLSSRAKNNVMEFGEVIKELSFLAHRVGIKEIIKKTLALSGYMSHLYDIANHNMAKADRAKSRIQNLYELLSVGQEFDDGHANTPVSTRLSQFLNELQLKSSQDDVKNDDEITLMTIHASKGLQYPVVFMVGMENGIFPSDKNLGELNKKDAKQSVSHEERRVCYVGMTRAEQKLYLTNSFERMVYGQPEMNDPSEFIDEIDPQYVHRIVPERDDDGDDIF